MFRTPQPLLSVCFPNSRAPCLGKTAEPVLAASPYRFLRKLNAAPVRQGRGLPTAPFWMSDRVHQTKSSTGLDRLQLDAPCRKACICVDLHFSVGRGAGLLRFYGLIDGPAFVPACLVPETELSNKSRGDMLSPQHWCTHQHTPPAWGVTGRKQVLPKCTERQPRAAALHPRARRPLSWG